MLAADYFIDDAVQPLPEQVAVHWDAAGNPDNYVSKAVAAFVLPLITAVINVIVNIGLNNDPKKMNAAPVLRTMGLWLIRVVSHSHAGHAVQGHRGRAAIQTIAPAIVGMLSWSSAIICRRANRTIRLALSCLGR